MLAQFHQKIEELGIEWEAGYIGSFDEVKESIIFDCAGIGAGSLNGDKKVIPVQGHLITLKDQPEIKYMIYIEVKNINNMVDDFGNMVEEYIYLTPKSGGTLGGTYIPGEARLNTNQRQHDLMLERAIEFFGRASL